MLRMALTGHRPERLNYSQCLESDDWRRMIDWLKEQMKTLGVTDAYCGMADGGDCAYAVAAIELKKEGYTIKLHCVLPCDNYNSTHYLYDYFKQNADTWVSLSKEYYRGCDDARDQYMVDNSDKLFAIYDGLKIGGVYSTIRRAKKKNLEIVYYPKEYF